MTKLLIVEGVEPAPHNYEDDPMKLNDVEYYEYECGSYCSPDGCRGHDTDIPVAIEIGGIRFVVGGYDAGDFPSSDEAEVQRVKEVVAYLEKMLI